MYFSSYYLEKLKLKNTDLVNISDKEQIQKICLQWMSLSSGAQNETEVETYTRAYHRLISPYDKLLIKPSQANVKSFLGEIKEIIRRGDALQPTS